MDGRFGPCENAAMESSFDFALAALALLALPGPTNTLLAAAGASAGIRRSLRLIMTAAAAYAVSIGLLILLFGPAADADARFGAAIRLAASLWLAWSAAALWRGAGSRPDSRIVTHRGLFTTTLLNPKTLIFAFVIFPQDGWKALAAVPLFVGLVALAGTGWIAAGVSLSRARPDLATPRRIARASAVTLAVFAAWIAATAAASLLS